MGTIPAAEVIGTVQEWLSSRGKSSNTLRSYAACIRTFLLETNQQDLNLKTLEATAAAWLNHNRRTVSYKTTACRVTAIRILGRCYGLDILRDYTGPTVPRTNPHPLPNGLQDLEKMMAVTANYQQRALLAFCGLCGLRVSEARGVTPDDVNLQDMMLTVRGKGERIRVIPISERAWQYLAVAFTQAKLENEPSVLRYSDRRARTVVKILGEKANLSRPISSHDLRATFATEAYRKSKDIRAVQELLGHASVEQTTIYVGINASAMRSAASF